MTPIAHLELFKWLAFAAMVVDHVDLVLFERSYPWMWHVGRFAMPVFAVCFGVGLAVTRDAAAVARRLIIPAILAQAAWWFCGRVMPLNILFTFAICAVAVSTWRRWPIFGLVVAGLALLPGAEILEGGAWLVGLVVSAFLAQDLRRSWIYAAGAAPWILGLTSPTVALAVSVPFLARFTPWTVPRWPGALSWLYPGHLVALALLRGAGG